MQREISDKSTLVDTLNPINDARRSTAIDRTTSNYNDAKEKVQKIRDLINMGKYDADLAKYIPGLMDLAIQGMLDDIDTREKVAHPSYKDKEQLDFQILLTDNYHVNPSNIHICFPIKMKSQWSKYKHYWIKCNRNNNSKKTARQRLKYRSKNKIVSKSAKK